MKQSFYRNLVIIIGILAAIDSLIQFGIKKAVLPIILDLVIVIVLVILTNRAANQDSPQRNHNFHNQEPRPPHHRVSRWQKQHDQWWQNYRRRVRENPQIYIPSQREIKTRINSLRRQTILANNQKSRLAIKKADPDNAEIIKLDQKINQLNKQITKLQAQLK